MGTFSVDTQRYPRRKPFLFLRKQLPRRTPETTIAFSSLFLSFASHKSVLLLLDPSHLSSHFCVLLCFHSSLPEQISPLWEAGARKCCNQRNVFLTLGLSTAVTITMLFCLNKHCLLLEMWISFCIRSYIQRGVSWMLHCVIQRILLPHYYPGLPCIYTAWLGSKFSINRRCFHQSIELSCLSFLSAAHWSSWGTLQLPGDKIIFWEAKWSVAGKRYECRVTNSRLLNSWTFGGWSLGRVELEKGKDHGSIQCYIVHPPKQLFSPWEWISVF